MIIIGISFAFFVAEISVGFYTRSLALIADAFHYLNDLIGFIVALVALKISDHPKSPDSLSFGWQRAQLLGAFFNGVFLLALGVSIFLQAIERFVALQHVENPQLVLIIGCIGLALNIISATFLHEHDHGGHSHGHGHGSNSANQDEIELRETEGDTELHQDHRHIRITSTGKKELDFGISGVLIHVIGDAINNLGVIIEALVIWLANNEGRFYADPGVSMGIALLILASAIPLVRNSGSILLESVPLGVNLDDVQHDLELISGVSSIHELHVWRLNQSKAIASAHVVTSDTSLTKFMTQAQLIGECLHAYGIHSITLQPELAAGSVESTTIESTAPGEEPQAQGDGLRFRQRIRPTCRIACGTSCNTLTCCG